MSIGCAVAGMIAALAAPAAAGAATLGEPCTVVRLPVVQGGSVVLQATDPSGRHQLGVRTHFEQGTPQEFLVTWHDGQARLGPRLPAASAGFSAVNAAGVAAGSIVDTAGRRQAAVLAYGRVVALPAPPGAAATTAKAINGAGQVAGERRDGSSEQPVGALTWAPDGAVTELHVPPGYDYVEVVGIDEDGTVLGVVTNDLAMHSDSRLVVWRPGAAPRILAGTSDDDGVRFWPVGLRGGAVTGIQYSAGPGEVVRWDVDGGPPQTVDTGEGSVPVAVNAGGALLMEWEPAARGPVLFSNGVARPLAPEDGPRLSPTSWGLSLSDDNRVFGSLDDGSPAYADCS